MPLGLDAIVLRDDGTPADPRTDLEWLEWIAAGDLRHWCRGDPLLDWLSEYPQVHGMPRDDQLPGYDEAFDLGRFLMRQGRLFEHAVIADLAARWEVVRIATRPDQARSLEAARATWEALRTGVPIVAGAVVRDPQLRAYGVVDLLVRSDVLGELCPGAFGGDPLELPVIGLSHGRHYRVVDVKFRTVELLRGGDVSTSDVETLAQLWVYNEALGRMQGYTPPSAFIVGRAWRQGDERGDRCWERLGRVRHDTVLRGRGLDLREAVQQAAAWVRRVRTEGAEWRVLPVPSIPELWPNMKASDDGPWHEAKKRIADALADLTLLPRVSVTDRARAHALGITRWDDPRLTSAVLGLRAKDAQVLDAVLEVNRGDGAPLRPARLRGGAWRTPGPVEAYVDFEFMQDLGDDFSAFPRKGGQALIFQIGSGTYRDGRWSFRQFTVRELTLDAEARMIDDWLRELRTACEEAGCGLSDARLVHWSVAEQSNFERAYDNARARHPEREWPALPWFDLLSEIVRVEPVVVRGAFSFSLKAIARAMRAQGLIAADWGDGLADGAGAMAGAWNAAVEASRTGVALVDTATMAEIARYNEVDCRAMAEILDHLRREH